MHPSQGPVLFDTGYSEEFFKATKTFPERFYRWTTPVFLGTGESAVRRLGAMGLEPKEVGHIILSHFHADHVAGLKDFPDSRLICLEEAWSDLWAKGRWSSVRKGLLWDLIPEKPGKRLMVLKKHDQFWTDDGPWEGGSWDIFGDGLLRILALPGHAAGHAGLLVKTTSGLKIHLADAAWSWDELLGRKQLNFPARWIVSDWKAYTKTQKQICDFLARRKDVQAILSHETSVMQERG